MQANLMINDKVWRRWPGHSEPPRATSRIECSRPDAAQEVGGDHSWAAVSRADRRYRANRLVSPGKIAFSTCALTTARNRWWSCGDS